MAIRSLQLCLLLVTLGYVSAGCRDQRDDRTCEAICDRSGNCELRAAVVLSNSTATNASLATVLPVLELAELEIRRIGLWPDRLRLKWLPHDDQCDASYALIGAIDAYADECVHVFFGPVCEYALASIGRIVKFLGKSGTPLLTVGGLSYDFVNNKTNCSHEYYMLTRAGLVGFKDMAFFVIDIMYKYNWTKILIVNEPTGQKNVGGKMTCHLMMKTMAQYLKEKKVMYSSWDTTQNVLKNFSDNLRQEMGMKYTNTPGVGYYWFTNKTRIMRLQGYTRAICK